jgi:serine/threonine protein kinase
MSEYHGGKMIDKGMYSCIFNPSLLCKGSQPKSNSNEITLSKLILKKDAYLEFKISSMIRRIPQWKLYFAVSESICEPSSKQVEEDLNQCSLLEKYNLSEFRILSTVFRGITLHSYSFQNDTNLDAFATHLIAAGALMNLHGIVHRDLHQGNILIDTHTIPRIIDFNLSISVHSTMDHGALSHSYEYDLSQEPPDSTIVNAIYQDVPKETIINDITYKKYIIKQISLILQWNPVKIKEQIMELINMSRSIQRGNQETWFYYHHRTIDSWAIGVIIISLIIKLKYSPIFESHWHSFKKRWLPLLHKMCAISCFKRIDCVQALYYLNPKHHVLNSEIATKWIKKVGTGF